VDGVADAFPRGHPNAGTRAYRTVVVEKSVLTAVIAVAWIALSRSASSIGLIVSITPLAIAGYTLTALAIGALLMLARSAVRSEQGCRRTRESIASVRAFVPHTAVHIVVDLSSGWISRQVVAEGDLDDWAEPAAA
jgi:hypothetical protein